MLRRRRPAPAIPRDDGPARQSRLVAIWLESRIADDGSIQRPLTPRRFDRPNLFRCLDLARLEVGPLLRLFRHTDRRTLLRYTAAQVVTALAPAAKVSTMASLMNLVQDSLSAKIAASPLVVAQYALVTLLAYSANRIVQTSVSADRDRIESTMDASMQIDYIRRKLSLSIPTSVDPLISAMSKEAAVFVGFENMQFDLPDGNSDGFYDNGPFGMLQATVISIIRSLLEMVSTATLLSIICPDIIRNPALGTMASLIWTTIVLVLAFLPILSDSLTTVLFSSRLAAKSARSYRQEGISFWVRRDGIRTLIQDTKNREEIVLFGLADWIASKWRTITELAVRQGQDNRSLRWKETFQELVQESGQVIFYSLIALQALPFGLTLGSIKIFQGTADQLSHAIRHLRRKLYTTFQAVFLIAAWLALIETCDTIDRDGASSVITSGNRPAAETKTEDANARVDYEQTRNRRGMKIQAQGLSYKYPSATTSTLRDINLTIEPGEPLAIVGFNGSGKTTLLKVLIGLYDHGGRLLVNDVPSQHFYDGQLHRRTTACFQEYSKHYLSLRDNIALGRTSADAADDSLILDALSRAEGTSILEKVDLGSILDPYGVGSEALNKELQNDEATRNEMMGTDLKSLSLGQWQKISLARGFLASHEADLVVFDEPSASLDPSAEKELFARIRSLSSKGGDTSASTTTIYISHRFSTVRHADKIAVVEDGTIIEHGSHDDLMSRHGRYRELFEISREGYVD